LFRSVGETESSEWARLFSGRRYISLESYDDEGKPRRTPVQSVEQRGTLYVRTDPRTWKVKRIRNDPRVRVALCDRLGKPVGEWLEGEAQILEGPARGDAAVALRREYGPLRNLMTVFVARLRGEKLTTVLSIRPSLSRRDRMPTGTTTRSTSAAREEGPHQDSGPS
jgi:PPOX class probable F420-dependent enzyme